MDSGHAGRGRGLGLGIGWPPVLSLASWEQRVGWSGVSEASTAWAGLGPPSPRLCTSAQVLAPCELTDVPSTALAPARPPHVQDPLTCVSIHVTPCHTHGSPDLGFCCLWPRPTASGSRDWVRGQGWEHPQGAGSKERMPQGPGGSQDSFGVTAGGTLGHTRGTLEPKEALDPSGGWKSSRGWERFQPVRVGPADLGAGGGLGPGLPYGTDCTPHPPSAWTSPHLTPPPSPAVMAGGPSPLNGAHLGGLRAWAPLLTRDPTLPLVGVLCIGGSWGVLPGGWPASTPPSRWPGTPETAQLQALELRPQGSEVSMRTTSPKRWVHRVGCLGRDPRRGSHGAGEMGAEAP
ncbi:PREDICTED: uncharacterized protein LOC107184475 [Myotis davidii]|uniref:uncharacterized protein LOC107184475 n=1 Tax=Myotis davidii TaxID=225400 RepID=UPI0007675924|nr:PREDICTED: uncharacterized protein LOC107184475 [Myotis davidii]